MTNRRPGGDDWHDTQAVVVAGGVAALILLGLLGFGVMRVSRDSVDPPGVVFPSSSAATTPASGRNSPTSTSYPMPSVQTSEATAPSITGPPTESPSDDPGGSGDAGVTQDTPTTIYNPYATPSSSSSAGHI